MKAYRFGGFAILSIQLICTAGCRKNPSGYTSAPRADGVPVYLFHRDYGCEQTALLKKIRLADDRLADSAWKNDTLYFTIRFGAICCSAFDDAVSADTGRIEIVSRDIATDHCRCMCVYYKDFAFLHPAKTPVRIVFSLQPWPPLPRETLIDTLLQIQ
jgi:hypothetical protein